MAHPGTQERPGRKERIVFVRVQLHLTHFEKLFIEFQAVPPEFELDQ